MQFGAGLADYSGFCRDFWLKTNADADESVSKDIVGHKPERLKDTIKLCRADRNCKLI